MEERAIDDYDGVYGTEAAAHIRAIGKNVASLNSLDVGVLFEKIKDPFAFRDAMRYLSGKYKEVTGSDPNLELIVTIDMLGDSNDAKRAGLRRLKAMREDNFWRRIIRRIVVKGADRERTVALEPNVFNSDVHFEQL